MLLRLLVILALSLPMASAVAALDPLTDDLAAARKEQAEAEKRLSALEGAAQAAGSRAQKLARQRTAAGAAIEATEAAITAAEIELRGRAAQLAGYRRQMAESRRPVSSLLAGLATMSQRPPILALVDRGGVEDLVRTRILLNSTIPYVRARSAGLEARVRQGEQLESLAAKARAALIADRSLLARRQAQFAKLEADASRDAADAGSLALRAGDRVLAGRDALDAASANSSAAAMRMAGEILAEEPVGVAGSAGVSRSRAPFDYRLPAEARVLRGLAEIDRGGVRSRGLSLATARGSSLKAPAAGVIRFAGPFEDYDGVVIIDHGGGWISLLVNVATPLRVGTRVALGQDLGRALGPVEVELSHNGRRYSPAIIAGSSNALFKGR